MTKRFLLFLFLPLLCTDAFAQQQVSMSMFKNRNFRFPEKPAQFSTKPILQSALRKSGNQTRINIDAVEIGSATNALTTLRNEAHCLDANNDLNTVMFIHRNDQQFGFTSAQYRYAVSFDRGSTFNTNIGPLNPTASNNENEPNARFPQGVIYNPAGNTDPANAWVTYLGPWHNGVLTATDIWDGITYGVFKLDSVLTNATEHIDTPNNDNILYPAALCEGIPGEFWSVDHEYNTSTDDSLIIIYKGNFTGNDVSWTVHTKLNPGYIPIQGQSGATDTTLWSFPLIAFDPSGQYGWLGATAYIDAASGNLMPYFYRSIDSGQTWTGPMVVDLNLLPDVMNYMGVDLPYPLSDVDLEVDKNGDPHFVFVVTKGADQPGYVTVNATTGAYIRTELFSLTYSTANSTWSATRLDTINFYDYNFGTEAEPYYQTTRPQISLSKDGNKLFFMWADSDPNMASENQLPNLIGVGYHVDNDKWTYVTDFTAVGNWSGAATMHITSPNILYDGANGINNIPTVVTQLNPNGPLEAPTFFYFRNINFSDSEFVHDFPNDIAPVKQNQAHLLVPNPADSYVTIQGMKGYQNTIRLVNSFGQLLKETRTTSTMLNISVNDLPSGFYHVVVSNENSSHSYKLVVQR